MKLVTAVKYQRRTEAKKFIVKVDDERFMVYDSQGMVSLLQSILVDGARLEKSSDTGEYKVKICKLDEPGGCNLLWYRKSRFSVYNFLCNNNRLKEWAYDLHGISAEMAREIGVNNVSVIPWRCSSCGNVYRASIKSVCCATSCVKVCPECSRQKNFVSMYVSNVELPKFVRDEWERTYNKPLDVNTVEDIAYDFTCELGHKRTTTFSGRIRQFDGRVHGCRECENIMHKWAKTYIASAICSLLDKQEAKEKVFYESLVNLEKVKKSVLIIDESQGFFVTFGFRGEISESDRQIYSYISKKIDYTWISLSPALSVEDYELRDEKGVYEAYKQLCSDVMKKFILESVGHGVKLVNRNVDDGLFHAVFSEISSIGESGIMSNFCSSEKRNYALYYDNQLWDKCAEEKSVGDNVEYGNWYEILKDVPCEVCEFFMGVRVENKKEESVLSEYVSAGTVLKELKDVDYTDTICEGFFGGRKLYVRSVKELFIKSIYYIYTVNFVGFANIVESSLLRFASGGREYRFVSTKTYELLHPHRINGSSCYVDVSFSDRVLLKALRRALVISGYNEEMVQVSVKKGKPNKTGKLVKKA